MGTKKNLVMGLIKGYNWYVCEVFVRSFVKNVHNADMVIFLDDVSDFTRYQIEQAGKEFTEGEIKIEPFDEKIQAYGHPANTRWKAFLSYIEEHGSEYSQILCVDTRDAFFQGDVFDCFSQYDDYIGITYYGKNQLIGKSDDGSSLVYKWMSKNFSKDEAENLSDKVMLCPSTILGTSEEMRLLMEELCKTIPNYNSFGSDECAFDYIIHHKILPFKNQIDIESENGEIMHMNVMNTTTPIKIENDFILNPVGSVPKVVHAYDVNLKALQLTDRVYRSHNFKFDERFTDRRSILDQLPHLVFAGEYKKAFEIFVEHLLGETKIEMTSNSKHKKFLDNLDLSALTEEDWKFFKTTAIRGYGDTVIRMWEVILEKNLPVTDYSEFLELAIQRALSVAYVKLIPLFEAEKIVACIKVAEKLNHVVSLNFKQFILQKLFERAEFFILEPSVLKFFSCLDLVADLHLPLDDKWQRLKNEAHTWFNLYMNSIYSEDMVKHVEEKLKEGRVIYYQEDIAKHLRAHYEKGKVFYRIYRLDADFENGGLK